MGAERREHTRHRIHGGNAEFEAVMGRGKTPSERARVLDWSRGGLALKVKSPRRRFLFAKQDPVLFEDDSVNCTLRLPPNYTEIFVTADVVHVRRDPDDQDSLFVGLRFDLENTADQKLAVLADMLEPKARTVSGRLKRSSSSASQRISRRIDAAASEHLPKARGSKASRRVQKTSERTSKTSERRSKTSERTSKTSERRSRTSERTSKTSERRAKTSERLKRGRSQRSKRVSKRLATPE